MKLYLFIRQMKDRTHQNNGKFTSPRLSDMTFLAHQSNLQFLQFLKCMNKKHSPCSCWLQGLPSCHQCQSVSFHHPEQQQVCLNPQLSQVHLQEVCRQVSMMNHKMSLAVREGNRCKLTIKIFSECSHNSHKLVTVAMNGRLGTVQYYTKTENRL